MPRPATMEDVARRAQVSRALVSIVFRDLPGASEASRDRVREAARELGYAPDQRARLLSRRRSGLLGVQFGVEHPFHGELVEALYEAAEEAGFELALSAVGRSRSEERAVETLVAYRCEALILLGPSVPVVDLDVLGAGVPVVAVAANLASPVIDVVRTDDVTGAEQATQHLIGLGHRDIVHVEGGAAPGAADRRRGYVRAMTGAGLSAHARIVPGGLTEASGATAGTGLTRPDHDGRRPTAVLAFNDRSALGVLQAAARAGWRVPGDLSVVGYDDSRVAVLPWADLTTVGQDVPRLAAGAVAHAVARIGDAPPSVTVVPPRLVVRSSTAAPVLDAPATVPGPGTGPTGSASGRGRPATW